MSQEVYDTQVPASGTVKSMLLGTSLERAPSNGELTVYGRQEATSGGVLRMDLKIKTDEVSPGTPLTINDVLTPNRQDDIMGTFPCVEGNQILAKMRETAGFATDLVVVFDFQPKSMQYLLSKYGG